MPRTQRNPRSEPSLAARGRLRQCVGGMDGDGGTALLRVVSPLLCGASFRRVVVDLCDVDGVEGFGREAIEQLQTLAGAHDRQLAVLISAPGHDEVLEAR